MTLIEAFLTAFLVMLLLAFIVGGIYFGARAAVYDWEWGKPTRGVLKLMLGLAVAAAALTALQSFGGLL